MDREAWKQSRKHVWTISKPEHVAIMRIIIIYRPITLNQNNKFVRELSLVWNSRSSWSHGQLRSVHYTRPKKHPKKHTSILLIFICLESRLSITSHHHTRLIGLCNIKSTAQGQFTHLSRSEFKMNLDNAGLLPSAQCCLLCYFSLVHCIKRNNISNKLQTGRSNWLSADYSCGILALPVCGLNAGNNVLTRSPSRI